jgi:hypothetical protein
MTHSTLGHWALSTVITYSLEGRWACGNSNDTQQLGSLYSVRQHLESLDSVRQHLELLDSVRQHLGSLYSVRQYLESLDSVRQHLESLYSVRQYLELLDSVRQHLGSLYSVRQHLGSLYSVRQYLESLYSVRQHLGSLYSVRQYLESLDSVRQHLESLYSVRQHLESLYSVRQHLGLLDCPLSSILSTRTHNVSETGSVSVLRPGEGDTLLGPLERTNLNQAHFPEHSEPCDDVQKRSNSECCQNAICLHAKATRSERCKALYVFACSHVPRDSSS